MDELKELNVKVGEIDSKMNQVVDFIQGSFGEPGFAGRQATLEKEVEKVKKEQSKFTKLLGYVSLLSGVAGVLLKSLYDSFMGNGD